MKRIFMGTPSKLKSFIKDYTPLYRLYRLISKLKKRIDLDSPGYYIQFFFGKKKATIVQIGSNDGVTGDPLNQLIESNQKWKVIFVEPVPYLFERLKKNYGTSPRYLFKNLAIGDGKTKRFYFVNQNARNTLKDLPGWFDQLGSFDRSSITKHFNGALAPFIETMEIETISLNALLEKNSTGELTVLHIDTEGYDWKILSQLDFDSYNPKIILFEYKHLSIEELDESRVYLKTNYHLIPLDGDVICLHKSLMLSKRIKSKLSENEF